MDLQIVAESIAEEIQNEIGTEYTVSVTANMKNNNTQRIGITIVHNCENISPTIYINDLLNQYCREERSKEEIVREILRRYENSMVATEDIKLLDVELPSCGARVVYRLISRKRNKEMLENLPYIPFLDMAITFHIVVSINKTYVQTIKIDKNIQERWGVSVEQLFKMANDNTEKIFPLEITDLNEIVKKHLQIAEEDEVINENGPNMIVITNELGLFGASVILYEEVMQNIAEELDCDLFVIPSSVHEMILVPYEDDELYVMLSDLIKKINENFVSPDEVLSDLVYIYQRNGKKFITQ